MPDMDGCAETVIILAYATKTIQCQNNVHSHWVKCEIASTYTSLYHYKQLHF